MSQKLIFLPTAINFSALGRTGSGDPLADEIGSYDQGVNQSEGFANLDKGIEDACPEETLLFVLKMLPKDRHRVIALMLFMRELGYEFRYEDIASIWGQGKVSVFNTISRMKKTLVKAGFKPHGA